MENCSYSFAVHLVPSKLCLKLVWFSMITLFLFRVLLFFFLSGLLLFSFLAFVPVIT